MIKIQTNDKIFTESLTFLNACLRIGVDTETTGIDPWLSKVLIITMGNGNQQYVYDVARLEPQQIQELKKILENPNKLKILQNAKFDYKALKADMGIELNNVYDTMLVEQVITRGKKSAGSSLADLAEKYVGITLPKEVRSTFSTMQFGDSLSQEQMEYAARDVQYLGDIMTAQLKAVKKYKLEKVIDLENKVVLATGDMELSGIYLDAKKWVGLAELAIAEREKAAKILDDHFIPVVGVDLLGNADINYNSPQQLTAALNQFLTHPITSTKEEYLKSINHPVIKALLDYREKQKQFSTYGSAFLKYIHPTTKRIHPDFLQVMGTDSGRYSCQNPNLQNLPAMFEYREPFCAQLLDWRIVGADYSGMELRLLAELSMDPGFLEIFDKGLDPHATVGSMLYGKPIRAPGTNGPNDLGENMDLRRNAKTLNFGVAYGMGSKRLAAATGMDYTQAKKLIAEFWKKFPKVKEFFDTMIEHAITNECAISPLDGRIRWLKDVDFDDIKSRVHAENIAKNFPLQGGNASITKLALVLIREQIKGKQIKIINTIHDEILLEAHETCANDAKQILETCMINAAKPYIKRVPITVESYISTHWKK